MTQKISEAMDGSEFRRGRAHSRISGVDWLSILRRAAGAAAVLMAATGPCAAASQADWTSCRSSDLDVNVPACNRIMDDTATSSSEKVEARLLRALAYLSQNSIISAGRDLAAVLQAEPGNARALLARSIVEFRNKNIDQAVLDFGLAVRLDPSAVNSMLNSLSGLKEVAQAAEQKPADQARLDELQRPLIRCRTGTRQDNLSCVPIVCPAGQRLDGNSCVQIVCGTGFQLSGSSCIAITCPTGQRLDGNSCVQVVCGMGYQLSGSTCNPITCPTGQRLSGNSCEQIVCGSNETLNGNVCEPNKLYGAISLSRTRRLAFGASWDRQTPARAQADSMDQCRSQPAGTNCRVLMTTDACVSLYWTRTGNGWGAATGRTRAQADSDAYDQCRSVNRNCVRAGGFCNTGSN